MMSSSPSTFASPTFYTQKKQQARTTICVTCSRKETLSRRYRRKQEAREEEKMERTFARSQYKRRRSLMSLPRSRDRSMCLKILESTRAFAAPEKGEVDGTRIWKLVLCSGAEYEPPSVHRGMRSPNAVAVAAWLRAKLSKSAAATNKSSEEEGTVLASYASKLSMREPFHWIIIRDIPGKSWTPRSQQDEEMEEQKYEEQVAGLSAGCFVLDCSSLYENPRTKMKEMSRNEVHRLKRFAVTKRGNAPLLVIAASSKDHSTSSSKKLIEKAFREAGVPSSALIMRVDDALWQAFPRQRRPEERNLRWRRKTPRSLKKSIANSRTRSKDAERRSPVFQIAWKRRSRKCSNTNLPPSRPISNEKYWQILQTHETLGRILLLDGLQNRRRLFQRSHR